MALARPPRPRWKAAAHWGGVAAPVATLIQACTSRANSRKGTLSAGPQRGPGANYSDANPVAS
eukprot:5493001-Pyramimonas_sp.AAC.1